MWQFFPANPPKSSNLLACVIDPPPALRQKLQMDPKWKPPTPRDEKGSASSPVWHLYTELWATHFVRRMAPYLCLHLAVWFCNQHFLLLILCHSPSESRSFFYIPIDDAQERFWQWTQKCMQKKLFFIFFLWCFSLGFVTQMPLNERIVIRNDPYLLMKITYVLLYKVEAILWHNCKQKPVRNRTVKCIRLCKNAIGTGIVCNMSIRPTA